MADSEFHACEAGAGADVHLATGIAGRENFSARLLDVVQLLVQYALRHFRLHEVIDPRRAATPLSSVQCYKLLTRSRAQHSFRCFTGVLSV